MCVCVNVCVCVYIGAPMRVQECMPVLYLSNRTHSVDQAGLEHRNLPASASQVLGLQVCATTPGTQMHLKHPFHSPIIQHRVYLALNYICHLRLRAQSSPAGERLQGEDGIQV